MEISTGIPGTNGETYLAKTCRNFQHNSTTVPATPVHCTVPVLAEHQRVLQVLEYSTVVLPVVGASLPWHVYFERHPKKSQQTADLPVGSCCADHAQPALQATTLIEGHADMQIRIQAGFSFRHDQGGSYTLHLYIASLNPAPAVQVNHLRNPPAE